MLSRVVTSQGLDLKPGGDAISRLLMTVLAAVAEFERDLIRDRTRLGLAAARPRHSPRSASTSWAFGRRRGGAPRSRTQLVHDRQQAGL